MRSLSGLIVRSKAMLVSGLMKQRNPANQNKLPSMDNNITSESLNNIGPVLKRLRKEKGVSQGYVAKAINVTTAFVSFVESGGRIPTLPYLVKFAEFYKTPLSEIFYRAENK